MAPRLIDAHKTSVLEQQCGNKGLRLTEQRRVIARVLEQSDDHPDVEELHARTAAIDANISVSTVYRTMRLFEEQGIIARHDFRDGRSRYETVPDEHHDHLMDHRLELYAVPMKKPDPSDLE